MKVFVVSLVLSLVASTLAIPLLQEEEELLLALPCSEEECKPPNCRCASNIPPGNLSLDKIPQLVFFTFDDDVSIINNDYYRNAFYGRKNPDGCPVTSTLFVSHEYTDYFMINDLYKNHQEIALHSITHFSSTDYWRSISVDQLKKEFGGEVPLISKFANIPKEEIKGIRLPFLQLSGNNSFQALKEIGLKYDCSWPAQSNSKPPLWPYTLDYSTHQECPIGPCPTASIPGTWVVPMLDWLDSKNYPCSMVDGCGNQPTDEGEVLEWLKRNFERNYKSNKAPFGFYLHSAWFDIQANRYSAYLKFIDYLQTLPDVFLVGIDRGLQWIQNPVPIGSTEWPSCPEPEQTTCIPKDCVLHKDGEERYMTICNGPCPRNYPWLDNPLGE